MNGKLYEKEVEAAINTMLAQTDMGYYVGSRSFDDEEVDKETAIDGVKFEYSKEYFDRACNICAMTEMDGGISIFESKFADANRLDEDESIFEWVNVLEDEECHPFNKLKRKIANAISEVSKNDSNTNALNLLIDKLKDKEIKTTTDFIRNIINISNRSLFIEFVDIYIFDFYMVFEFDDCVVVMQINITEDAVAESDIVNIEVRTITE